MSNVAPGPSTRVLIADDEENQRNGLAKMVQAWGFSVETAADGQEALDKLAAAPVHVLVTDLMMPRVDGFEVLRNVRARAATRDLPIIVVTAKDLTDEDRQRLGHARAKARRSAVCPGARQPSR